LWKTFVIERINVSCFENHHLNERFVNHLATPPLLTNLSFKWWFSKQETLIRSITKVFHKSCSSLTISSHSSNYKKIHEKTTTKKTSDLSLYIINCNFAVVSLSPLVVSFILHKTISVFKTKGGLTNQGYSTHIHHTYTPAAFRALLLPTFVPLIGLWSFRCCALIHTHTAGGDDQETYLLSFIFSLYRT
jgi:hypothetical protein